MNQQVINKFNAETSENNIAYEKAKAAGFPWSYFMERVQGKARESGFLPNWGLLIFDARYVNSADSVVKGVFASMESVGDTKTYVGWCTPWYDADIQRWREVLCLISCTLFDAGVVAAFTRAPEGEEDPILRNGAMSIFGDVGFIGLRNKVVGLVREVGGDEAVSLMGEVGDCACVHLYADQCVSDRVFKLEHSIREMYVRNACKASYLAGAVFAEKMAALGHNCN